MSSALIIVDFRKTEKREYILVFDVFHFQPSERG